MSNPIVTISLEKVHQGIDSDLEYLINYWRGKAIKDKEQADNVFLAIQLLAAEGFDFGDKCFSHKSQFEYPNIEVKDMREFVKVHKALGHLENDGNEAATDDIRKPKMKIFLRPKDERFRCIRFHYIKVLPGPNSKQKGKMKCRLVRVQRSEVVLQCE